MIMLETPLQRYRAKGILSAFENKFYITIEIIEIFKNKIF